MYLCHVGKLNGEESTAKVLALVHLVFKNKQTYIALEKRFCFCFHRRWEVVDSFQVNMVGSSKTP